MRRIILPAFIMAMISSFFVCAHAANGAADSSALGTVTFIRHSIDSHEVSVRRKSEKLFRLKPEELAEADFSEYDTSGMLMGTDLFDFPNDPKQRRGKNIEDILTGKENSIVNVPEGEYSVHTVEGSGKYPELFKSDMILRTANSKRAKLVCDYPEGTPDYQIVKNKNNIYVENVDFYDFPVIKFENCSNLIFNNCTFRDFKDNGVVFRACKDISLVNCSFYGCGNRMSDYTNGGFSIRIVGDEDCAAENILIENCTIDHSYGKAISFVGHVDDYIVRNNTVTNTVWGAIDYCGCNVSGEHINIVENNICADIGFAAPSPNDEFASKSGIGCSAIYAGMGGMLPKSVVKNNIVTNVVETGIEGPYEIVYHNTVRNTGERSAVRYTGSTEAVFIRPSADYEQKYFDNVIETRGLRCFSLYSAEDCEYKGIYITDNDIKLKNDDATINCSYARSDIEINCRKLKRLVIKENRGMMTDKTSVHVFLEAGYVMDCFDLSNPCMIGNMPERARYCFNIDNQGR